jgi:hypothetical protein
MRALRAQVLAVASLLFVVPLALPPRAAADEAPALSRPDDRTHPGHGHDRAHQLKRFLHHGGNLALHLAKRLGTPVPPAPTTPTGTVPASVVTGFPGTDESTQLVEPPDGAIAVSVGYVVEAVNDALSVWVKTYDSSGLPTVTPAVVSSDLNAFFGVNPNCYTTTNDPFGLVSDPSVDYDPAADRFVMTMISFEQLLGTSSLCVAVSVNNDPSGFWYVYGFPISPFFSVLDFPRAVVGADNQVYVTGNLFTVDALGNFVYDHARVYAFRKSEIYAGAAASTRFVVAGNDPETGLPADSLTPARAVSGSGMYFLSAASPSAPPATGSSITLWKWTDPFGANQFTQQGHVTVATYTQPPAAIQKDNPDCGVAGAACVETNDARNLTAYYFDDPDLGPTVYGAHHAGCTQGGVLMPCVQWYQVQVKDVNGAPALVQEGIVDDPANPGRARYFPSLAVDRNGNVAVAYAYSSATEFPGIAYVPISAGVQGSESVLKAGEAAMLSPRYGDYAGTALDPFDNLTIWHIEEYSKAGAGWGTWISAIQISGPPPAPDFSVGATQAPPLRVVPGGSETYGVTVTALAGFTDPVALSVSGLPAGATGTFSPDSVTLESGSATSTLVVTTGATTPAGTYTLTITATGGGLTHTRTVSLTVADFAIVNPGPKSVLRGRNVNTSVRMNALNGFTGQVGLALGGLPAGASASWSVNPVTFNAGGSTSKTSTLSIRTTTATPRGTYTLTITGFGTLSGGGGSVTHRVSFRLTVQ